MRDALGHRILDSSDARQRPAKVRAAQALVERPTQILPKSGAEPDTQETVPDKVVQHPQGFPRVVN